MDISNISAMYQNYNQTAAGSATGNQICLLYTSPSPRDCS